MTVQPRCEISESFELFCACRIVWENLCIVAASSHTCVLAKVIKLKNINAMPENLSQDQPTPCLFEPGS